MPTSPLRRPRARALRRLAGTCPARRRPRLCRASSYTCHGGSASTHLRSIRACYARGALAAAPRSQAGPRRARHLARRGLNSTIGRWSASALTTRRTLSRPARGGAVTQPRTLGTGAGCGRRQASVHHGLQCSEPRAHSLHARRMPLLPGLSQTPPLGSASGHACPTALAPACLPCKALRAGGARSSASQGWRGRRRGRARTLGVGRCQDDQLVILRHGLPVVHGADLEAHLRLPLVLQHGRHADVRVQLRARRPALARLLALAGHGRAICGPTSPILAGRGRASRGPTLGQLTLLPHSCKCISQSMSVRRGLWTGFVARRRHSPP